MAQIIDFKKPAEPAPQFGVGNAFCIGCKHEWIATVETGTTHLQCPECESMKGRFKFEFSPAEGELVRECNCGNQYFYITPQGHMCANCGIYQEY